MISRSDKTIALSCPDVSVIVPTIGRETLTKTVLSILHQSYGVSQVLVCADGVENFAKARAALEATVEDRRVQVVCCEWSGSPAIPRNTGLSLSTTELVAFCDDDDLWASEKLQRQIPHFEAGTVLVATNATKVGNGQSARYFKGPSRRVRLKDLFRCNPFIASSVVCRREALLRVGGFPLSPPLLDDYACWLRLLHEGDGFILQEPLVVYSAPDEGHVSFAVQRMVRNPIRQCLFATLSWSRVRKLGWRQHAALLVAITRNEIRRIGDALRLRLSLKERLLRSIFESQ